MTALHLYRTHALVLDLSVCSVKGEEVCQKNFRDWGCGSGGKLGQVAWMPVDVVIAPPLWTDMHESDRKLKMRVRRIKEGRDLRGGFAALTSCFPDLCENKPPSLLPLSLSQPCLPVANLGPTRILPHLYLGSQKDVLNKELMTQNGITYVLNASITCPKPDFISENHFLRIPVNDSYCEKLLPWLEKTNEFIDKAKVSNCRVIVHCLAGISRSATIAIAYIMETLGLSSDDAYRFVKERRPSISPNFNFLGQLLEFERDLKLKAQSSPSLLRPAPDHTEAVTEVTETVKDRTLEISHCSLRTAEPTTVYSKLSSPTSLQRELSSLTLSTDQILRNKQLKCSFSLNIQSVYSSSQPSHASSTVSPSDSENMPRLFKLDSPENATCRCPSSAELWHTASVRESKLNLHRDRRGNGSFERLSATSLSLDLNTNLSGPAGQDQVHHSNTKTTSFLSLAPSTSNIWTSHRGSTLASTPVTPTEDNPWLFGPNLECNSRVVGTSSLATLSCQDKSQEGRDFCSGWLGEGKGAELSYKRRSCQMEFEESVGTAYENEDFGKLGKQSNFSGSMEVIEVS